MTEKGILKFRHKLAFSFGHVLNDLSGAMWFSYLLVYLQYVMQLPPTLAGVILMFGQIADGLATPLIGYESDRLKPCCNYGKRKTTHIVGTICVLLSFPFIFIQCYGCLDASPRALLIYFIPIVSIFQFGWAAVQVSHLSLIPDLSHIQGERDELTIMRYLFDVVTNISMYLITWAVFSAGFDSVEMQTQRIDQSDDWRFRNIALILTAVGIVTTLIFHFGTPERTELDIRNAILSGEEAKNKVSNGVTMKWSDWFREKKFYQVGLLLVIARLYLNLNQAFIPLYLQEGIQAPQGLLALIPLVFEISGFIASLLIKYIIKIFNKKVSYILATCCAYVGCIWLSFDTAEGIQGGNIYILAIFIGIGSSMMMVLAISFTADLIGSNTETGAFVFGAISFVEKIVNGLFILTVQISHDMCGDCQAFYQGIIAHGISTLAILSLAIVLTLDHNELGVRSEKNTVEGREQLRIQNREYGAVKKGFPIFQRADRLHPLST